MKATAMNLASRPFVNEWSLSLKDKSNTMVRLGALWTVLAVTSE